MFRASVRGAATFPSEQALGTQNRRGESPRLTSRVPLIVEWSDRTATKLVRFDIYAAGFALRTTVCSRRGFRTREL
jgi:hypothetical protein